jgi:hypothetical protein
MEDPQNEGKGSPAVRKCQDRKQPEAGNTPSDGREWRGGGLKKGGKVFRYSC